jgi:hypothetical protein
VGARRGSTPAQRGSGRQAVAGPCIGSLWHRERCGTGWVGGGFRPTWLRDKRKPFYFTNLFINGNQFEFKLNLNSE